MVQDRQRVVWFEGMTLDPQHLQQWDRSQRSLLHNRIRRLTPFSTGLTALQIDRESLANGEFVVTLCSGVMPDGLAFNIPDEDEPPPPRALQPHLAPTQDRLGAFLAIPPERLGGANVMLQGGSNGRPSRYRAETIVLLDENTGADERPVEIARPNFEIRFGSEPLAEFTTLKVAEVRRTAGGVFVLDDDFVPTCTSLQASERLMTILRRQVELMVTKSAELAERRQRIMAQREISPSDVAAVGLSASINTHVPLLNHHLVVAESHPENVFLTMLSLAGQLATYTGGSRHPRDFPVYDHADLTSCFNALDALIREMLGAARPSANYVEIALSRRRDNLYVAQLDEDALHRAQLFLAARSDRLAEHELAADLPRMLRLASSESIDAVLRSSTRALPIHHTNRLPSGMPVDDQASYFQIQKHGPFWEAIAQSSSLAIFIPSEIADVNLKLIAANRP